MLTQLLVQLQQKEENSSANLARYSFLKAKDAAAASMMELWMMKRQPLEWCE